jgi:thiosulfate/3-mercaptopyruvate sulfurtransferase
MTYKTFITTTELTEHLDDPDWAIIDCRFTLAEPDKCEVDYLQAHIPGAVYAHLDHHLTGPIIPGETSRHPLPKIAKAAEVFSNFGIAEGVQVIAYDDTGGALAAGRLWWMLRWLGHQAAAVLEGGWSKWQIEERRVVSGREDRLNRQFIPKPRPELLVSTAEVSRMLQDPASRVFDARAPERYRGEVEPIDPVAGHIPGAISAPYADNMRPDLTLNPKKELRNMYQKLLGDIPAEQTAFYCGSGVTSIHNILTVEHIGLGETRLYAGSWSKWITDPERPVAKATD